MAQVQTPTAPASSVKDTLLLITALIAVLGSIVAFYWFDEAPLLARVGMVVAGVVAGGALLWVSSYGHAFVEFFQAARVELRKVVWPSREMTGKTTVWVFVFAALMGFGFFLLDMLLGWMTRAIGGM
jgi:preprotein translocase subunit SecE